MKTQIFNCEQGTPEWHESRSGVITSSNFHLTRARLKSGPDKGRFSKAARQYAFRLAFERVVSEPLDDTYRTAYMERGNRLEDDARLEYELSTISDVEEIGFIKKGNFGYSPDGLVGTDGAIEIKCFVAPDVLMPIFLDGDLGEVMDQIQGGLWITDRKWCDFVLYIPSLAKIGKEITVRRVERDDRYIADLMKDLYEFERLVQEYKNDFERSLDITPKDYEIRIQL